MARERNLQLDGLRGYAAAVVAIFHTILILDHSQIERVLRVDLWRLQNGYDALTRFFLTIFNGETAVTIFFVLSGAVLFESLARDATPAGTRIANFTVRRFLRIYPTLLICLVICWAVYVLTDVPTSLDALISNALLAKFEINGATWTLSVEMLAVPLILASYFAYRRFGQVGLWVVGIGLFFVLKLPGLRTTLFYLKYGWISLFFGMVVATDLGRKVVDRLPTASWPLLLLAVIFLPAKLQSFFAALLVGLIYYGKAGGFGEFLQRPLSKQLGDISYSFYLFNVPILTIFGHHMSQWPWVHAHPLEVGLLLSVAVVILTLPLAYLSLYALERPSIQLGRWLTRRRTAVVEPQPQGTSAASTVP